MLDFLKIINSQAWWFMLHKFQHSGKLRHKDQEFLAVDGETAKQERAFAALSEDPGLIPSNYIATHNPPGTHMVAYMQAKYPHI